MNSTVFLLLSDKWSPSVLNLYHEIEKSSQKQGDCFILFHQKEQGLPEEIRKLNYFTFTDNILYELNYTPIENKLVPGSNHFPVLQFYLKNPNYSNYWLIEDDVRFNGNWELFFETFSSLSEDFISCNLTCFSEDPSWYWWSTLFHPFVKIPLNKRLRSFNPIYRISNIALKFIHASLLNQWSGHHEVLFPTLLKYGGYDLMDFGGDNDYVLPGFKDKFYTNETMRFRPVHTKMGKDENKLYHPIKEI